MIQTIRKAWGIPELRKKIVFTLLILLIFRLGNAIMVPYINRDALALQMQVWGTGLLGLYNVMSGGAFATATVFALSIQPYINSSIIIQLLTVAIPALERLARDGGEEGKRKIQSITRYATLAIAVLQGWGYYALMKSYGANGFEILTKTGVWPALVIIVSFIAGSTFVMWMGEQITEFGIGNGISIILFAGILSRVPTGVSRLISNLRTGDMAWWGALLIILGVLALIVLITWVNDAERRIPVQQSGDGDGQQLDDDGAVDIGLHAQGKDRCILERAAGHDIVKTQHRGGQGVNIVAEQHAVHIGNGDGVADAEDQKDQSGKNDLLAQLGDRPCFTDRRTHLDHLCLSTGCFDRFLSSLGESSGLHGHLLGNFAVAQDLDAVLALAQDALGQQSFCVHSLAVLELVQSGQVDRPWSVWPVMAARRARRRSSPSPVTQRWPSPSCRAGATTH